MKANRRSAAANGMSGSAYRDSFRFSGPSKTLGPRELAWLHAGWFQSDHPLHLAILTSGSRVTHSKRYIPASRALYRQEMRCLEFYSGLGGADKKRLFSQTQLRTVGFV